MNHYDIHALHGFLGHPEDWLFLGRDIRTHHLFKDFPVVAFDEWAQNFNQCVKKMTNAKGNILLGYSLGGRLGLHALLQDPTIWNGAVFISTHAGMNDQAAKQSRIELDGIHAEKFLTKPWDSLMEEWNNQEIFKYSVEINRSEADNSRQALANALQIWSLGYQQNLKLHIEDLKIPICWIAGENDTKFVNLAKQMRFKHPKSKVCLIPRAGHRVLFDQPEKLKLTIAQFIHNLE